MKALPTALVTGLFVTSGLCAQKASSPTQSIYGQCGGKTWDGPTACQTGTVCNPNSEWFYQCLDQAGIVAVQSANSNSGSSTSNSNGNNNNNPPAAAPAGPGGGFRGGGGHGPPGGGRGRPGGGRGGGRFGPPGGFTPPGNVPPQYTQPPNNGNNNGGNNGGNNNGNNNGGDDGDGDTVVTRTITTIFNVGSATVTSDIPYLTVATLQ
ncbi:hypothetical protein SCUCBS95973_003385 [Sporothrix curviconia]|uniref:CBM1 domain-containing protein n=1 Tax=Sporothrix curviconia TaxID=1260050 RepID=A0ABP0BEW9_9PEZI